MRTAALTTLATVAGLLLGVCLLGVCAQAQQPPEPSGRPVALPASPPPDYGPPVSNEQAKAAADAAITEAKKNNWHMAISIVGPEGELIYFEKMDGAQSSSAALAQAKARTSALFRRPSKVFADQFSAGNAAFMSFPDGARPIASEGGIPIILNGNWSAPWGQRRHRPAQDTNGGDRRCQCGKRTRRRPALGKPLRTIGAFRKPRPRGNIRQPAINSARLGTRLRAITYVDGTTGGPAVVLFCMRVLIPPDPGWDAASDFVSGRSSPKGRACRNDSPHRARGERARGEPARGAIE